MMKKANKLINEKSPYLLQHAYNPVDWFPWGEEAFQKALKEDKPVFLSIGYSTCHWCHVMEKESFENEEVASLMNDNFVSIKVDREERPDIDGIYMSVCQMLTGFGGWPLTIIMTPDKKPFFAGTYFPRQSRYGRNGMMELLPQLKNIWDNRRDEVLKSTDTILKSLQNIPGDLGNQKLDNDVLTRAYKEFSNRFDEQYGGFGSAPKFPSPHNLSFLLNYFKISNEPGALKMLEKTLMQMRMGGIFDHIGFGFSRYSTDREWLVPHFEKMLYDQALLSLIYTQTYLATNNLIYKKTAEEILTYVSGELTSPEGGFYSAEDADSESEEGKFYLWTEDELKSILNEEEFTFTIKVFSIRKEGNWFDPAHGGKNGTNILHLARPKEALAGEMNITKEEFENKLENIRQKIFNVRIRRIHPYKDDKILTDWNGLMISAFAAAAQAFDNEKYAQTAVDAAEFILNSMFDNEGRLLHRYREGDAAIYASVDDYSFLIQSLIDLYETVFEENYLIKALELTEHLINHFWDEENRAFYFSSDYSEKLLIRQKEIHDGAIPSGNSIATLNLLRLGRMTGNIGLEEKAKQILDTYSSRINSSPSAFTQSLIALDFALGPSKEIIIIGNKKSNIVKNMLKEIRKFFIPNKIILLKGKRNRIIEYAPFLRNYNLINGNPAVFICENYQCKLPVDSIELLRKELN